MLRALTVIALATALTGCGARHETATHRATDPSTGIAVDLPPGWHLIADRLNDASAVMLATYPVHRLGDVSEQPPRGASWMLLWDGGPMWTLPGWSRQLRPLPARLPPEQSMEGFGRARMIDFRAIGHQFTAYVKGDTGEVLPILRSLRLTPFGRSLALVIHVRAVDGVRIWEVGNPRSSRRLIVVGCPETTRGCSGFAVTNRLVNGPAPLAMDLWVIQQLRGRERVLSALERRLQPEATIRLGTVRDPDAWTRRIVALAR